MHGPRGMCSVHAHDVYTKRDNSVTHSWQLPDRTWHPQPLPGLMGILNVTPDSFSDGGQYAETQSAVEHALQLIEDGADIIDIGGESTRPGADPVSETEELRRTVPVIQQLAEQSSVPISIDTTKASVAREALNAGASILNDISGLTFDPKMVGVCAASNCGVVCMHIRGTPQTMQNEPTYDDCVAEVCDFLRQRLSVLESAGIAPERVCLDPGIGFGKTAEHNMALLQNLRQLHEPGRPLLVGHSRKRFLSKLLGRQVEERLAGTIGVAVALATQGADFIRVHDVRATRDALVAWHAILQG